MSISNIVHKPLAELQPYGNNPVIHTPAQVKLLADSITKFGFNNPLIIDKDGLVVAGHGRLLAAKQLGIKAVPCVIASHLTPELVRAYRLADNKLASTDWNLELLSSELDAIVKELAIKPQELGFTDKELNKLLNDAGITTAKDDDFNEDAADGPANYKVQYGDVWQLDRHRLMCGDATVAEDMAKLMEGRLADLCITDPPYGIAYGRKKDQISAIYHTSKGIDGEMTNDNLSSELFSRFLGLSLENISNVTKAGGVLYVFYAGINSDTFIATVSNNSFKISQILVWIKNHFVVSFVDYKPKHEHIIYGWKRGAGHYFREVNNETTVIHENHQNVNDDHPTMKPVPLLGRFVVNSSRQDELVIDPFAGSGSTLMACDQLNRECRLMELEPKFCSTIIKRWERASRLKATLLSRV